MRQAEQQARRAADVVARLRRGVERPAASASLQPVVLQDAVRNAFYLLEPEFAKRQVAPKLEAQGGALAVQAEPVALEQIIHNLLTNALQALDQVPPEERKLSVRLEAEGQEARSRWATPARHRARGAAAHLRTLLHHARARPGPGLEPVREPGLRHGRPPRRAGARAAAPPSPCACHSPHERPAVPADPPDRRRRGRAQQPGAADLHRGPAGAGLGDPQQFLREFPRQDIGAIVLDVRMPGISGLTVLDTLVAQGWTSR